MAVGKNLIVRDTSIYLKFHSFDKMSFNRYVKYQMYNPATGTWEKKAVKTLAANASAPTCDYTFTGLSPNTSYQFRALLYVEGDNIDSDEKKSNGVGGWTNIYPTASPQYYDETTHYPMTDYGSARLGTITKDSVDLILSSITPRDYQRTVGFYFLNTSTGNNAEKPEVLNAYSTTLTRNMPGLTAGVKYEFEIRVYNPNGDLTWQSGTLYATPTAYNYTITSVTSSATSSIVTIYVTIDKAQDFEIPFKFTLYYDDDDRVSTGKMPAGNTSMKWQFLEVPAATRCEFTIYDTLRGLTFPSDGSRYIRRTKNDFSWNANVDSGSVFDILAGSAADGTWDGSWNDYTSQLKEKANYYGREYNPATVKKGDVLTAEKMNNIAAVINWLVDNNKGDCETKLDHVDPGDPVTAKRIKLLAQCLNE